MTILAAACDEGAAGISTWPQAIAVAAVCLMVAVMFAAAMWAAARMFGADQ